MEKIKNFFAKYYIDIKDFIRRNLVWLLLFVGAMIFLKPALAEYNTLLLIIIFESLAMALSNMAVYVYTSIPYNKELLMGNDSKYSTYERSAMVKSLGLIFLGVHVLVGLVVFGVYIGQFANV